MTWLGVIYYEKCNYYVLVNCIPHCIRGEFIQNYFKIFNSLEVLEKKVEKLEENMKDVDARMQDIYEYQVDPDYVLTNLQN